MSKSNVVPFATESSVKVTKPKLPKIDLTDERVTALVAKSVANAKKSLVKSVLNELKAASSAVKTIENKAERKLKVELVKNLTNSLKEILN